MKNTVGEAVDSLVRELQKKALSTETTVSDLLRMALVVARKLGVKDFEQWVTWELNGYGVDGEVPPYRRLRGELKVLNPYHRWQPLRMADTKAGETLSKGPTGQSIGEIESLLESSKNLFCPVFFEGNREEAYGSHGAPTSAGAAN